MAKLNKNTLLSKKLGPMIKPGYILHTHIKYYIQLFQAYNCNLPKFVPHAVTNVVRLDIQ